MIPGFFGVFSLVYILDGFNSGSGWVGRVSKSHIHNPYLGEKRWTLSEFSWNSIRFSIDLYDLYSFFDYVFISMVMMNYWFRIAKVIN